MFDHSKAKIGYSSSISNKWTHSSLFDVRKNDVQVSLMSKSSESHIRFDVWCSFVRSQKLGVPVRSSIDEHVQVPSMFEKGHSSSFDVRLNGVWPIPIRFTILETFFVISRSQIPTKVFNGKEYIFLFDSFLAE